MPHDRSTRSDFRVERSDPDEARKMLAVYGGVVLNVAKQRNGDFEGKIGLWFDQKTYRYR
jgi:twinkle protein